MKNFKKKELLPIAGSSGLAALFAVCWIFSAVKGKKKEEEAQAYATQLSWEEAYLRSQAEERERLYGKFKKNCLLLTLLSVACVFGIYGYNCLNKDQEGNAIYSLKSKFIETVKTIQNNIKKQNGNGSLEPAGQVEQKNNYQVTDQKYFCPTCGAKIRSVRERTN